jgi:hypothetical protein
LETTFLASLDTETDLDFGEETDPDLDITFLAKRAAAVAAKVALTLSEVLGEAKVEWIFLTI